MSKENIIKQNIFTQESGGKSNFIRILKGSLFSVIISIILLTIFASLLVYTDISEITITPVVIVIVGVSILIGSMVSVRKIRKNGLLNGGIVGLIYILALYIISSSCLVGFGVNTNSIIMMIVAIITGMLGGILGVNIYKR